MQDPNTTWTVDDHVRCDREIRHCYRTMDEFVDQLHAKKCTRAKKSGKFKFHRAEDHAFYKKHCFYNKKRRDNTGPLLHMLTCNMANILFMEHKDASTEVYGGGMGGPETRVVPRLSNNPTITHADRKMIHSANAEYVECMRICIDKMAAMNYSSGNTKEILSWYSRVKKIVDSVDSVD